MAAISRLTLDNGKKFIFSKRANVTVEFSSRKAQNFNDTNHETSLKSKLDFLLVL